MRHVLHTDPIAVSPPGPQTVHTPAFEMTAGTRIVVEASGEIGSGVLFSGTTPPAGWNELAAGDGDRDWPYRGRADSFRYSLIGTFVGDGIATDWFYIGPGRTVVGNGALSGSAVRLRLAVNRPHVDSPAAGPNPGDGRWDVVVDVYQPEPADAERRPTTQDAWQWCNKCQGLSFAGSRELGRCAAGGEHDHLGSGNYVLTADGPGQGDWRWCNKCQGLFFHGNNSFGRCPAGGSHAPESLRVSANYTLVSDGPGQRGWRWCNKCESLFFNGSGSRGRCPVDGEHNVGRGEYVLTTLAACQHLAATFSGQVTMQTAHDRARGPFTQDFTTPMVFATDCRSVRVSGFPAIALTFDTDIGPNTTTVSLRSGGVGLFERRRQGTRPMEIPVTLFFSHSNRLAGDSELPITFTTGRAPSPLDGGLTGSPLGADGTMTLVGAGRFRGGFLGDRDCTLQLVGRISPAA